MNNNHYPENLLKKAGISTEHLPDDIEASILYVLGGFTERQQFCLLRYYRDGLTLEKVAHELDVTRERIRQINGKTVRMLRAPHRRCFLEKGVKGIIAESMKKAEEQEIIYELNEARKLLAEAVAMIAPDVKLEVKTAQNMSITEMRLEELELSVRSFNSLIRSGVSTIGDFLKLSADEIYNIRNFGKKSYLEVKEKIISLGVEIPEEWRSLR